MKRIYLLGFITSLLLSACGGTTDDSALNEGMPVDATTEDVDKMANSFRNGEANDGQSYFSGLLAEVIAVDVKHREIDRLDEENAPVSTFKQTLDSTLSCIDIGRQSIAIYTDKNWPKRAEFHDLTVEWFDVVEHIVKDYLYDLAEPMSRPDDTWDEAELELYEKYLEAYDEFIELDQAWVDFQYVYAEANGFRIEGTIDVDAMVDEAIENN